MRQHDPRFQLHQRQPRADKLDARQRQLCRADPAFLSALQARVRNADRFAAFLTGSPTYTVPATPCAKCRGIRKRTRDRSCYACHLERSGAHFARLKQGVAPVVQRSLDSHLDRLERAKAERVGLHTSRAFNGTVAKQWPTGRLEIIFPDGYVEADLAALTPHEFANALLQFPDLVDAIRWAGWTIPG